MKIPPAKLSIDRSGGQLWSIFNLCCALLPGNQSRPPRYWGGEVAMSTGEAVSMESRGRVCNVAWDCPATLSRPLCTNAHTKCQFCARRSTRHPNQSCPGHSMAFPLLSPIPDSVRWGRRDGKCSSWSCSFC